MTVQKYEMLKTTALLLVLAVVVGIDAKKKYCDLCPNNDHTMCLYKGPGKSCQELGMKGVKPKDQQEAVDAHNQVRSKIANGEQDGQPAASNMQQMSWDNELSKVAQRWAEQCQFDHDTCRDVKRFKVGQNAYVEYARAPGRAVNWTAAVYYWYDEVRDFDPKDIEPFVFNSDTGHYTQTVWAETNKVGCGFTQYKGAEYYESLYICDYGPAGNVVGGTGVMYKQGEACSDCLPGTTLCQDGLCV